ncbi:PspC domain-containing protein [Sporichthya sp.]|uniref:PspC domain-containing protein n=1 Tax=Sporichthya sp. TaxID=65475 RepID=UPI0017D3D808|nr:PspC domain-containing protein [Sporichthya sp.]MBA3744326.1 PspC domain-containing protein [Sporichthya sp.]
MTDDSHDFAAQPGTPGTGSTAPGSTAPGSTATASTPTPPRAPGPRRFRRSKQDRTLAGVCGGLAESLGMDPVIVRVLMVVLTFFGGAGLVVYGACWLLMPEDDRESSLAEQAIARGRTGGLNAWPVLALAGVLALVVVLGAGTIIDDRGVLLIALVVVVGVLLARRENDAPPQAGAPPALAPSEPWASTAPTMSSWSTTSSWPPAPTTETTALPPLPPTEPARTSTGKAPRSILGRVAFCGVLLALGVLATIDLMGADVPASAYPVVVVAGAGLGLLIGARYGRGRWLIALGILGVLALPPTAFADEWQGGWVDQGDRQIVPVDAASVQPSYEYRGGRVRLDFGALDFAGRDVRTEIRVGAGDLLITVPATVNVITELDLGAGSAEIFGEEHDGIGVGVEERDDGTDGAGGGTLTLDVEQGMGHMEVRRAAA